MYDICAELKVTSLPLFYAYAYGEQVFSFAGSNMEKALAIAKMAAQVAEQKAAALAEAAAAAAAAEEQQHQP